MVPTSGQSARQGRLARSRTTPNTRNTQIWGLKVAGQGLDQGRDMTVAIAEEFGRIPMSPFLKATLVRAADYAAAQMHREVTLEHLLLALAEDPEASIVLKSSAIDIQRLMSDVSGYLGRNDDRVDGSVPPAASISGDLRRILEASAAAASQGRRREINGAIVLAAIVGDGKSPAAHMLRSQGLTFEQAIRALQQAASAPQPVTAGRPPNANQASAPAPRATTADDIMASARERVMSRTAPPDQAPESRLERTQPPIPPVEASPPPVLQIPIDRPASSPAPQLEPERPAENARGPASNSLQVPVDADAGRMAQTPAPRLEMPGGPSGSNPPANPVPYPQAAQPARPTVSAPLPPQSAPAPAGPPHGSLQPMPAPSQGWAPALGPAPQRQSPFPPMNGMRPPVGGPAPLPPFPPANQGAPGAPSPTGQPPQGGAPQQPMIRQQGQPQSAPWAEQGGPSQHQRGQHYDEAMARLDARRPQAPLQQQGQPQHSMGAQPAAQQRRAAGSTTVQAGQLAENIPRKMRVAIPVIVEARVARADVKAIADGLQGDGAVYRHEVTVTKAMSVRLRAPDGGFTIETASPETQWIENVLGLMSNDYASWRWSVTPQLRGKRKLQMIISARTVGTDGLTAETALPDQVIDVAVGVNVARTLAKWGAWVIAAVAGGLLSRFGETIFNFGKALLGGSA